MLIYVRVWFARYWYCGAPSSRQGVEIGRLWQGAERGASSKCTYAHELSSRTTHGCSIHFITPCCTSMEAGCGCLTKLRGSLQYALSSGGNRQLCQSFGLCVVVLEHGMACSGKVQSALCMKQSGHLRVIDLHSAATCDHFLEKH